MLVKDLIRRLKAMPQNRRVIINSSGTLPKVKDVCPWTDPMERRKEVWIMSQKINRVFFRRNIQ